MLHFFSVLKAEMEAWCQGRNWIARLPFLVFFGYTFVRHLLDPFYNSVLGPLNLGIHELGHLIFMYCGMFLNVLGGTFTQCVAPIFGMVNFFRQKDWFSLILCFGWLSTNFFYIALYVGDARAMELPLVSPFGTLVVHDWNYLLGAMHLLNYDRTLSLLFRMLAGISMLICLIAGSWVLYKMAVSPRNME